MSVQEEDARDLELQRDLVEARLKFLDAGAAEKAGAQAEYLNKLREFSDRVLLR